MRTRGSNGRWSAATNRHTTSSCSRWATRRCCTPGCAPWAGWEAGRAEAALALGATRWETVWQVLIPYGRSGIFGAFEDAQEQVTNARRELLRIARDDSDKKMRARALFWLGQKDDPRVAKLIGDRVLK